MPYVVRCLYRPGGAEARLWIRDRHVRHVIERRAAVSVGGALTAADGTVTGMFLILEVETPEEVRDFLAAEPYGCAELFAAITCERLDRFVPHADPGFLERLEDQAGAWIRTQAPADPGRPSDDRHRRTIDRGRPGPCDDVED